MSDRLLRISALLQEAVDLPPTRPEAVKAMAQDALDLIRDLDLEANAWKVEALQFDAKLNELIHTQFWFSVLERHGLGYTLTSGCLITSCPHCTQSIKVPIGVVQESDTALAVTVKPLEQASEEAE